MVSFHNVKNDHLCGSKENKRAVRSYEKEANYFILQRAWANWTIVASYWVTI